MRTLLALIATATFCLAPPVVHAGGGLEPSPTDRIDRGDARAFSTVRDSGPRHIGPRFDVCLEIGARGRVVERFAPNQTYSGATGVIDQPPFGRGAGCLDARKFRR